MKSPLLHLAYGVGLLNALSANGQIRIFIYTNESRIHQAREKLLGN